MDDMISVSGFADWASWQHVKVADFNSTAHSSKNKFQACCQMSGVCHYAKLMVQYCRNRMRNPILFLRSVISLNRWMNIM